jgi:hypothetical protein
MGALTACGTAAAAFTLLTFPTITFAGGSAIANPGANSNTRVVLDASLRDCDFSPARTAPGIPAAMLGTGWADIRHTGSSAVAEVHLDVPNEPGTHYIVGVIEEPRPSSASCGPGAAGTSFGGLDTDAAGVGTTTVQDNLRPGATGVWVVIERPNPHSQDPAEFYTSEFLAPV